MPRALLGYPALARIVNESTLPRSRALFFSPPPSSLLLLPPPPPPQGPTCETRSPVLKWAGLLGPSTLSPRPTRLRPAAPCPADPPYRAPLGALGLAGAITGTRIHVWSTPCQSIRPSSWPATHRSTCRCYSYESQSRRSRQSNGDQASQPRVQDSKVPERPEKQPDGGRDENTITTSVSKYFHFSGLPHLPHRPTKEELLAAATGFWHRLKIRFKWVSIRSMRPWNADEWGAFVSWFFLGHIVWILVGTTTFMSLVIFSINTVFAQETLARWVGDYLTKSAGVTVIFESAIVPKWGDGVISFRNVFVSRRPGQVKSSVRQGLLANAAAEAAAAAAAGRQSDPESPPAEDDDGNYTQFDLTIATVNVTLSLLKWWNGRGLLEDVEVKGIRGVVDRASVRWPSQAADPHSYRYQHQPGDFEIESFRLEDLLVTIYQPNSFRPYPVSIYSCSMDRLRKRWLFYDFLSANHVSGSFDGSLFTIHPRQVHNPVIGPDSQSTDGFQRLSRLRIDGLNIDHLNRGVEGPFGWIYEGNVDIVADVMFPAEAQEGIGKVMTDLYEEMVKAHRDRLLTYKPDWVPLSMIENPTGVSTAPAPAAAADRSMDAVDGGDEERAGDERKYLVMDLRMHLNDVKAAVPLFSTDFLVRPIVAYINAKNTYIPVTCRIVKRASDFDGSWTIFDCGLMNDMSVHTYEAFAKDVEDQRSRVRRLKKVGLWTLSVALHAVFMGMAGHAL